VTPSILAWAALIGGILVLLVVDLLVLHRGTKEISIRDALWSTTGFVAVGVLFGLTLAVVESGAAAQQFFAGYVLEWSLSLDNVFVWALIFSSFGVSAAYQHRLLFYGIFGALLLRGGFVAVGAELLHRFEWVVYVFGAMLLISGIRMLRGGSGFDPRDSRLLRLMHRALPTTRTSAGSRLIVRARNTEPDNRPDAAPLLGRWYATPMVAVLVAVESSDIIFAVDSIPAIFGVTREPYIVFAATAFALVGLRSMYFLLVGARERFVYLDKGIATILIFIGAEFLLTEWLEIGPLASLIVIVSVISAAIGASLWRTTARRRDAAATPARRRRSLGRETQ
jgi:tellurite resistance protein TerC